IRLADEPVPVTGATVFYAAVFLYYLVLDWHVALFQAPVTLGLLVLADGVARWPFLEALPVFLAAFAGGWTMQLIGHGFEGRRPALADNVLQVFNAPLFLVVEALMELGFRPDLKARLRDDSEDGPPP